MATITTNLSTTEFINAFGGSSYVRDFSFDAVEAILEHIDEMYCGEPVDDWTPFFMDAGEYTDLEFYNEFNDKLDTDSLLDEIQDALSDVAELNEDGCFILKNQEGSNDEVSLTSEQAIEHFSDLLIENSDYMDKAVDMIADQLGDVRRISVRDSWLVLGAV